MAHDADETAPARTAFQLAESFVQGVCVQGAETLVQEQGVKATTAPSSELNETEGKREARLERLAAGQGAGGPCLAGLAIDDLEVVGEAIPTTAD